MQPAGLASFLLRKDHNSKIYSYEKGAQKLPPDFEKKFKANKKAWEFYTKQTPSFQKAIIHWILAAKQETTQLARLDKVIAKCGT